MKILRACLSRPRLACILLLLCGSVFVWQGRIPSKSEESASSKPLPSSTPNNEPPFEDRLAIGKRFAFKVANYQFLHQSQKEMKRQNVQVNLTRLGDSEWFIADHLLRTDKECIVYSFGVAERDAYTELMARKGCRVFAMDPTVHHPTDWMPNVQFYPWGLANRANTGDKTWSHPVYGTIKGSFYTLPEIIHKLGHTDGTPITALKLDCEGCEFAAFQELLQAATVMPNILQIDVEFHFASTLGMVDDQDVARLYYAHIYLKTHRCRLVRQRRHEGFEHDQDQVPQVLVDAKVPRHYCCYEMTYVCKGRE